MAYASANRDECFWGDPEAFRVERDGAARHLGFSFGEHQCVVAKRGVNNALRGIESCIVSVH